MLSTDLPVEYSQLCSFYSQGKNDGANPNFFWISIKLSAVKLFKEEVKQDPDCSCLRKTLIHL